MSSFFGAVPPLNTLPAGSEIFLGNTMRDLDLLTDLFCFNQQITALDPEGELKNIYINPRVRGYGYVEVAVERSTKILARMYYPHQDKRKFALVKLKVQGDKASFKYVDLPENAEVEGAPVMKVRLAAES